LDIQLSRLTTGSRGGLVVIDDQLNSNLRTLESNNVET